MTEWLEFIAYGYLAVTLLTLGATLSQGVRLLLVLSGALIALLGLEPVQQLTDPHLSQQLAPRTLNTALSLILLLIPAWCILDSRHRPRLSVADGFLIGFLPGFGADALLFQAQHFTWMIPAGQSTPYSAGYGWGCGIVTLAWSAGYRFGKDEHIAQFWASLAFGWALVDRLSLPPFTLIQGRGLVWVTMLALIHLGLHERYWVRRSVGYRALLGTPELEIPTLGEVLQQLGPAGLAQRWRAKARRKQVLMERQELVDMGRVTIAEVPQAFKLDLGGADLKTWALRVLAAGAFYYALTGPPDSFTEALLVGLILLNYLIAPDLEPDDADPAVRVTVESILLHASLAAVLLWFFLHPTRYLAQKWEVILAFAFFAASWAGSQQLGARAFLRPRHRKLALLHRALTLLKSAVLAAGCVYLYPLFYKQLPQHPTMLLNLLAALAFGAVAALAAQVMNHLIDFFQARLQQQS